MANSQGYVNLGADTLSGAGTGAAVGGPLGAIIGGVAGLGEGIYGLFAQNNAEQAQQAAAQQAQQQLQQAYQQSQQYEQPYMQMGGQAATQLGGMISSGAFNQAPENFQYNYQEDPAFRNQLAVGNQQVMANAGSMGSLFSGATMKALQKYGVNMANQNYNENFNRQFGTYNTQYTNNANQMQNQFNRMFNTANMGQQAAGSLTRSAQDLGQGMAGLTMQRGNAQAAGDIANAQTVGSMIGSAGRAIGGMFAPTQNRQTQGSNNGYQQNWGNQYPLSSQELNMAYVPGQGGY